jgi:GNAT superfamily N-acetyltransferase
MVEIKQLPLIPTLYELEDLFEDHWEEVYGQDTDRKVSIDFPLYGTMEDAGSAFGLFAFYDNLIVGYSVNFLGPNVHAAGGITCTNDALYVDPLFRDTPLGIRLIKGTSNKAKEFGADMMTWNSPMDSPLGKILARLGYRPMEVVYCKEI